MVQDALILRLLDAMVQTFLFDIDVFLRFHIQEGLTVHILGRRVFQSVGVFVRYRRAEDVARLEGIHS